jgi:hypothetical protein
MIEQDHGAIKRRCALMLGLKTFNTARIRLAGIELAHRIRKGQFSLADQILGQPSLKTLWEFALYPHKTTFVRHAVPTHSQPFLHQN